MSNIDDWLEGAFEERTEAPDPADELQYDEDADYDRWKDSKLE